MLSFNANIPLALNSGTAQPIFLLDLEYNAGGSSYTLRLSNRDVIFSTYQYYGIVLSFGNYHQTADLLDFTTSVGSMRVVLNNNPGSLKNTRFSDLFSTQNFINRKWTLWLWESHLGTTRTTIAKGYISSDFEFDDEKFELTLDDYSSIWSKDLPRTIINKTDYANCPDNNVGKPLPMFYGDADVDANAPTVDAEFDRYFTNGKVPALITNQWDDTNDYVIAKPDTAALKQLREKNIFLGKDKYFCPCEDANCSVTAATPQVTFKGNTWRVYIPLLARAGGDATNPANSHDGSFTTYATITANAGNSYHGHLYAKIGKLPNLGTITAIYAISKMGSFGVEHPDAFTFNINVSSFYAWDTDNQILDVTSDYSAARLSAWNLEDDVDIHLDNEGTGFETSCRVYEVGLEIEFAPSESFVKEIAITKAYKYRRIGVQALSFKKVFYDIRKNLYGLENVEQVYIAGKGRMFGSWIDNDDGAVARATYSGTDPGYDENDLIENPVYIVEDIFRRELTQDLTPTYSADNLDIISFDLAGSAASAKGVYTAFNNYMPKFLFSQTELINSIDLIYNIGYLCNTWFFFSGDGMIKAKTRLYSDSYSTSYATPDKTINYNDIFVTKITKTPISNVFNDITVNYKKNYLTGSLEASVNNADATSKGTTVNGYNQALYLNIDADLIYDYYTVYYLGYRKLSCHKSQSNIIEFTVTEHLFKYWDLEICDVIKFSNWDANRKVFGTTPGADWFSIFDIYKYPDTGLLKIKCFEVS